MVELIPAIDLRGGQCVRLHQGRYDRETVYERDPVAVARSWQQQRASWVHVVDLDAARGGGNNKTEIAAICQALTIAIQVGGGIRTLEDIRAVLALGVRRVILGTSAVRDPDMISEAVRRFSAERVVIGIDAQDGEVRVQGWTEGSGINAIEFALDMEKRGVQRIVYTDIARDGTMEGPNLAAYQAMGRRLSTVYLTASGGVGTYQDLIALGTLHEYRVDSVIVGRSLYEQRFSCQQLWEAHAGVVF